MTRILLLVVAFIVYGSLYPWRYRPGPAGSNALTVLLGSWPATIGRADYGDIAVNIVLYVPVGLFAFLALDRQGRHALKWFAPALIAFALSALVEMAQVYDQTRVCSLLDLLDNTLGGAIGVVLGSFFRNSLSNSLFLAMQWLGCQCCLLLGSLVGKQYPKPSRLELGSIAVAWFLAFYVLVKRKGQPRATLWGVGLAAAFLGLLLFRGLAPYHLQMHATAFSWVPFLALLKTEWITGLPILLEKSFYYGTAIWLLRETGVPMGFSTVAVAGVLAAIEAIQRYLPGRTPEITDPILALVLGAMLWWIEEDHQRLGILQIRT